MQENLRLSVADEDGARPVLSVIVPSYNERPNVAPMIAKPAKNAYSRLWCFWYAGLIRRKKWTTPGHNDLLGMLWWVVSP